MNMSTIENKVHIEEEHQEKRGIREFWNWLWHSESWMSYIVFLIIIFIIIKFILFPTLTLIFGTSLPLAIVESSSMDHNSLNYCMAYDSSLNCIKQSRDYSICGNTMQESKFLNSDEYWQTCGKWYEQKEISKEEFLGFSFKNGFRKGDIMIISGKKNIEIGDVLIFNGGMNHPIIHRVVSLNPIQTKGDHNEVQLPIETNINPGQIIGVALGKIPYAGWPKVFLCENLKIPLICA